MAGGLSAAMLLGHAASAQISNITTGKDAELTIGNVPQALGSPVPSPYYVTEPLTRHGAGYAAFADVSGGSIFFEAGSMSAGNQNSSKSIVEVSFDVTNDSAMAITQLKSTLFESTYGFYVADFFSPFLDGGGNVVQGCSGAVLPNCGIAESGAGFSNFTSIVDPTLPKDLAFTSLKLEVLQDGATVRELSGSLLMQTNGAGGISFVAGPGNADLAATMNGFSLEENTNYAYIFGWDRTDFTADLLNPLGFGETSSFTYRITTETWTNAFAFGSPTTNMIVSFACFADPLGRGGNFSAAVLPLGDPSDDTCDDFGQLTQGGSPKVYTLGIPTIKDGQIVFTTPGGIPEPDSWAMLIAGFGLVGLSMRKRKNAIA